MKKRTAIGIGAGLAAGAIAAVSCHAGIDDVETVYGPPIEFTTSDPADEIEDVYGPPVDFEEPWDTGEEAAEESEDWNTGEEVTKESEEESIEGVETVYGPPIDFEEAN